MPFTGSGTGIQNANDVFFSGLGSSHTLRYNSVTSKWNNLPLSVSTTELADDAVTESKLSVSNSPVGNQFLRWNGTALEWASISYESPIVAGTAGQYWRGDKTWHTLDKTAVGLSNVDNTSDAAKNAASVTLTNKTISGASNTFSNIPQSAITSLTTDLGAKVPLSTLTTKGDLFVATAPSTAARQGVGTNGQVLTADSSLANGIKWADPVVASVAGKTGAVALAKADVGLSNVDNTSDLTKPISTATQTALDLKVDETISVTGGTSLTGGGALTTNRTIALVNDAASPGNSMYYGTNGTGTKGFYAIPTGDPAMGGDLTGNASNAQLGTGVVGTTELAASAVATAKVADDAITEPKLSISNAPTSGQVLSWNGTSMAWAGTPAYTRVNVTADYTVPSGFRYVFADATSGGITVTLPAPVLNTYVRVKRMNGGANGVQIVAPAGAYIDASGAGSDVLGNQYDSREYWSDGSNWFR